MKNLKFIILTFLVGVQVFAMDSIGRVVKLHGDVSKVKDGESVSLKKGDHLFVGSKIISGPRSFVKIFMKDDTIFQLGPNSEFALEKFEFKTKSERTAVYNLAKGKLRSLFTVKAPKRTLKIKTPTASMGVRGTEILSDVYKFKGKVTTDIALLSGSLEVRSKGITKKIMMKPGFVYKSSLSNSIKKSIANGHMRKMDKRVFAKAKRTKTGDHTFLHDVRKNVDKRMVKGVKFETHKELAVPVKRVPATKEEMIQQKPQVKPKIKPQPINDSFIKGSPVKIRPTKVVPVTSNIDKIKSNTRAAKSKITSSSIKRKAMEDTMKKRAIQHEIDRRPASNTYDPPPRDGTGAWNNDPTGSSTKP